MCLEKGVFLCSTFVSFDWSSTFSVQHEEDFLMIFKFVTAIAADAATIDLDVLDTAPVRDYP